MRGLLVSAALAGFLVLPWSAAATRELAASRPRPDGLIVFSCYACPDGREPGGLSTIRPDGSALREIPGTLGDLEPAWSPDGRMLAVTRSDGIWLRAADGSRARRLTRSPGVDASPSWSPDGERIAFARAVPRVHAGGARLALWTVPVEGGRPRALLVEPEGTDKPEWALSGPDWSPDGRLIALGRERGRLLVIRPDGTGLRRLGPATLHGADPRWSPDGRLVAFVGLRDIDRPALLRILDVGGGRVRTVFETDGWIEDHAWSPTGRWVAIAGTRPAACEEGDPSSGCEEPRLWLVDTRNARRTVIYDFEPYGGDASGIDWRSPR